MQSLREFMDGDTYKFSAFVIARSNMPQIANVNDFINFIDSLGISHEVKTQHVELLSPTQTDHDDDKIAKIVDELKEKGGKDMKPIVASTDGFVIDGHHRYYASFKAIVPIPILFVDLSVNKLLKLIMDYKELRDTDDG